MAGVIKTGVTAWADRSLLASGWYPKEAKTAEARLRFYATQFPITENDSTYYALPTPDHVAGWVDRTPPTFTMNVKAFALLTEHYTDPKRLPPDLRAALPHDLAQRPHVYPRDVGPEFMREIATRFRDAIEPLRASGRLGVVLFQYPVWFPCSPDNRRRVPRVTELLPGCRVAVEFRNATWTNERHRAGTLQLLRDAGIVYTCVDEPQGFASSIPPIAEATSDVAVVRFHGRSTSRWNRGATSASERFRYLYTEDELREWVPKIRRLADETAAVHVLMNNCYSNYSVTNAKQMTELLQPAAARRVATTQREQPTIVVHR